MTISSLQPLPIGNAIRIFLDPPATARLWRVLRKTSASFADQNDPDAVVVYQGVEEHAPLDSADLQNGQAYTYAAFYFDGTEWTPSGAVTATPAATYFDQTIDVQETVRDRIEAGLLVEVQRGSLAPQSGVVQVLTAPPLIDDTRFPVVTVLLVSERSAQRAIGEMVSDDDSFDPTTGLFSENEGWLAQVHLSVTGWSKNADERIALRKVLRRLVLGNLGVFDAAGMTEVDFNQTDQNELQAQPPIYATEGSFTCYAPVIVRSDVGVVEDVTVSATATPPAGAVPALTP